MDNLKKRKVSDGIRRSVIKKRIDHKSRYTDDIKEPKESGFSKAHLKKKQRDPLVVNEYIPSATSQKNNKRTKRYRFSIQKKKVFLKVTLFIVVYCSLLFFIFSKLEKTKILLFPSLEEVSVNEMVDAFVSPADGKLGVSIIALSESREKKIRADSNIHISEKASGTITVFNNYSTEAQRLSPETRFKSTSGKIFKLGNEWVEIPGKNEKGPGSIDVVVYAEKPGPEYNIGITDFTIPGFEEAGLTAKYNDIYALSLKEMSGGFDGEKNIISEDLKKKTVDELESQLKQILTNELSLEKTDRTILVDNSVQIFFKEPVFEEIESSGDVLVRQDAQIFALLVEKSNLEEFLRRTYLPDLTKEEVHLLNFDHFIFKYTGDNIDYEKLKKVSLSTDIHAIFEWNIDKDLLLNSLVGLDKQDIRKILREFKEIDRAEVKIQPFWQKHISKDRENIFIEIEEVEL